MKQLFTWRIGIKVVLILVSFGIVYSEAKSGAVGAKVTLAVLLAIVSVTMEELFEVHYDLKRLRIAQEKEVEKLTELLSAHCDDVKFVREHIVAKPDDLELAKVANALAGLVGDSLRKTHEIYGKVRPKEHGYVIKNHAAAISAYVAFWEVLVASQRKRHQAGKQGFTALVVHSCPLKIWRESSMQSVLHLHGEFVKAGGKVDRILCGDGGEPDANYTELAKEMSEHGVKIRYYDTTKRGVGFKFEWDFLLVAETNEAVIWKATGAGIYESICTKKPESMGCDVRRTWEFLDNGAVPFREFPSEL